MPPSSSDTRLPRPSQSSVNTTRVDGDIQSWPQYTTMCESSEMPEVLEPLARHRGIGQLERERRFMIRRRHVVRRRDVLLRHQPRARDVRGVVRVAPAEVEQHDVRVVDVLREPGDVHCGWDCLASALQREERDQREGRE